MAGESDAALGRLEVLIGRWKTEGQTIDASGARPDQIDAIDTYERLPGGALLHLVDGRGGDQNVEGALAVDLEPVSPSSSDTTAIETPMRRNTSERMG
jgi:hypothetical protein